MWSTVWDCVFTAFRTVYSVMNTIKIFDINGGFYVSLWDLSVGVIVMGALINLFINFTQPTLPDKWDAGVGGRFVKNSKRMANNAAEKYGPYIRF